jgi:hypothetical protein
MVDPGCVGLFSDDELIALGFDPYDGIPDGYNDEAEGDWGGDGCVDPDC